MLLISSVLCAQNNSIETTIKALQQDQLLFEKVFVHTNKTKYAIDDVIWFKAYVVTNENKPSLKTTLLYVNLFSEDGELIHSKNVLIQNGVGNGQFELFGDLKGGDYYIQANTNYMKNFGEENKYLQKIEIKGDVNEIEESKANYDIQVFPEGGCLLEGVENTIGIKALINGKSIDYTGEILDSKNKEVARFKSKHLGMTKTKLYYKPSEKYRAVFTVKDSVISVNLPMAKSMGVSINTTNSTDAVLNLELKTNLKSINESKTSYTLLFHQNNKLIDYMDVNMVDTSKVKLEINKEGFFNGVNTVTMFKGNKPIVERKFFVYKKDVKQEVQVSALIAEKDSTTYKLKLSKAKTISNISLSVLSVNTNYEQTATIESAFLLTAYVKGYVEYPAYYFNIQNENRLQYIDLLLLTQGWTEYSTDEYINRLNPKYKYDFEQGFSLSGKVEVLKSNNLGILARNNQVVAQTFLNNKPEFKFKNLLVYKGDSIKVSFLKGVDKNIAEKPNGISFSFLKPKPLTLSYSFSSKYFKKGKESQKDGIIETSAKKINLGDVNELDEIEVVGKSENKSYLRDKKFNSKYRKQIFDLGLYNKLDIPKHYKEKNLSLGDYLLKDRGYRRYTFPSYPVEFLIKGINRRGLPIFVGLSLDGYKVVPKSDNKISLAEVFLIKMEDIERILFNPGKNPRSLSKIAIFTTDNYKEGIKELFKHYVFNDGYDKSKKYYSPLYNYAMGTENQEIDWKPNLVTNGLGETVFRIKNNEANNRKVFVIQGHTEHGKLISSTVFLD